MQHVGMVVNGFEIQKMIGMSNLKMSAFILYILLLQAKANFRMFSKQND